MKRFMNRCLILILILSGGWFVYALDLSSWKPLDMTKLTQMSQTTYVYDGSGAQAAELHTGENRVNIKIEDIPKHVLQAFISIEDARFYEHPGIDIRRIGGAFLKNIRAGGYREGASTITQQLIKLTHLTSKKTISRKMQEIWLALQLERRLDKDSILCAYLNTVYFGKGAYGIEAASQAYFDKSCSELSISEAALLAGIVKAPGNYSPHLDLKRSVARRDTVLRAMERERYLTKDELNGALEEQICLADKECNVLASNGWYVDWVLIEAADILDCTIDEVLAGGYMIHTSLNRMMQNAADSLYNNAMYFPGNAEDGTPPESALIALNPDNGEVLCMIGGRNYETRLGLNRAMQIKRQPGSTFKPISVYAAAIDFLHYSPISLVNDASRDFGDGYSPSNASGKEYGIVTLRQALTKSMNLAAMDLLTKTGIDSACMYAQRAGIALTGNDYNLSVALGSLNSGVSPAEMGAAYAPLINGGGSVKPHVIRSIEDRNGELIYEYSYDGTYVMSEQSGRMIVSMLEDAAERGTAKQLADVGFPVAAKTGTVGYVEGGNTDIWTIAITPSVSVAVWIGFDQPDDMHNLPEGITGGGYPAKLAAAFLKKTADISNGGVFKTPEGMRRILLDRVSIDEYHIPMLAGEHTPDEYIIEELLPEAFIPALTSDLWNEPKTVEAIYVQANDKGNPVISFIVPDSNAEYRIIRENGGTQTEVGLVQGRSGEYVLFEDRNLSPGKAAEYFVISRHRRFYSLGRIWESPASPRVEFSSPGLLERMIHQNGPMIPEYDVPLFRSETDE